MLSLFIATAFAVAPLAAPPAEAEYDAAITPKLEVPASFARSTGTGTMTLSDQGIRYDVTIRGVRRITNVALVDAGRAVELYDAGDSRSAPLHVEGSIAAKDLAGISFGELSNDMARGQTRLVVYTVNEPAGVLAGTLKPVSSPQTSPVAPTA